MSQRTSIDNYNWFLFVDCELVNSVASFELHLTKTKSSRRIVGFHFRNRKRPSSRLFSSEKQKQKAHESNPFQ